MSGDGRFVIQQHDATRLHWDLRLEHDGVLMSWALPRGVPWNPKENRLAVKTEDHPLEFLDHEGDDFDGEFGTGRSTQWDRGTYELHKLETKDAEAFDGSGADELAGSDRAGAVDLVPGGGVEDGGGPRPTKVVVTLSGRRVSGKYALFSMRGTRDWLIHRMDPPVDSSRRPVPIGVVPMRATVDDMPSNRLRSGDGLVETGDRWAYERCWNGIRAIVTDDTGRVVITDSSASDISMRFPEVRRIGRAIGHREVILDGVIVPVDTGSGNVRDDRAGLRRRLRINSDSGARNASRTAPVVFMAFDILWSEGHPITSLPWELRRRQLDDLRLDGPGWRTSSILDGDEAEELLVGGRSGVVAKRMRSIYEIGVQTDDWIRTP